MTNKRYISGRRFEWKIKKVLEENDYLVTRSSASKGLFDLIGIKVLPVQENKFVLELEFLQLKKNISHEQAKNILHQIQYALFKKPVETMFIDYINKDLNYFKRIMKLLTIDYSKNNIINSITIDFGIIYTLPKKKKK
jgi:hypothetical protein